MNRLIERILGVLNPRQVMVFAILAVVLGSVVLGVSPLIFRSDTTLFLTAVLFGLSVGWITGRIPMPPWAAGCMDAALGMDFLFLTVGRLDIPLRGWIGSSAAWIVRLLPQYWDEGFDIAPWVADAHRILQGSVSVIVRFQGWAVSISRGGDFFDPIASALFWSLLFFLTGTFAGWACSARNKPFDAILPAVLLLGGVFAYVHGDWHYAVLTIAFVLVMVATVEHSQKEQEWEHKQMGYSTSLRWDLVFSATPVLAVLLVGAYVLPSISMDDISRWIREQYEQPAAQGPAVGQSFGLNPAPGGATDRPATKFFPRSHYLGSGPDLSREVALVIVTGESLVYLPGVREPLAPRHYWKSLTYDIYSSSGWLTSPTEEQEFQPEAALHQNPPNGIPLHQIVTVNRTGMGPVYAAGELTKIYQLFRVVWRTHEDLLGVMIPGTSYEADSVYLEADEYALRAAGTDYPDWIRGRYLQLPNILPQRIHALARELTATPPTPYDRALAIQAYLRREMHYSLEIGAPPYDRDVVDYFLFESKEGFCDYYATAMVVLARSAGIPARISMGYASGTFDPGKGKYTVLESDAHAWPELYFPGIGWVEFEPTSAVPEIQRPSTPSSPVPGPILPQQTNQQISNVLDAVKDIIRKNAVPAFFGLLSIPALFLVWTMLAPVRFRILSSSRLMRAVYRGLLGHGRRQGIRISPATTPAEFTRQLARRNPAYEGPLVRMAELYSREVYGGGKLTPSQRMEVIGDWPRLDRGLWWSWLRSRLRLFPRPRRDRARFPRGGGGKAGSPAD